MDALNKFLDAAASGKLNELEPDVIEELRSRFPYFSLPCAIKGDNPTEALTMADALDPDSRPTTDERHFYPPENDPSMTTEDAIDTFIETYGSGADSNDKEMALLEKLIFNPTPDYSQVLEQQASVITATEAPEGSQDDLINRFLASHPDETPGRTAQGTEAVAYPAEEPKDDSDPQPSGGSLLSESLAKIYIRRGRYSKAYEIIHSLSLNFPEKSVYFADQLRFLQKLMLIEQAKAKNSKPVKPEK